MPDPQTTRLNGLKALRDHLVSLDSGSGDAEILTWAINGIERLRACLAEALRKENVSEDSIPEFIRHVEEGTSDDD